MKKWMNQQSKSTLCRCPVLFWFIIPWSQKLLLQIINISRWTFLYGDLMEKEKNKKSNAQTHNRQIVMMGRTTKLLAKATKILCLQRAERLRNYYHCQWGFMMSLQCSGSRSNAFPDETADDDVDEKLPMKDFKIYYFYVCQFGSSYGKKDGRQINTKKEMQSTNSR